MPLAPMMCHPNNQIVSLLSGDQLSSGASVRLLPPGSRSGKSKYIRAMARSSDTNPMAHRVVRQPLGHLDMEELHLRQWKWRRTSQTPQGIL